MSVASACRGRGRALVGLALTGWLTACGAGASSPTEPASPPASAATPGSDNPDPAPSERPPGPSEPTYTNPVYSGDFPDPHVLVVDGTYFAYATNTGTSNVPVLRSTNLVAWDRIGDALPALPRWAVPNFGSTWAPGVTAVDEGVILYFVARDAVSERQCIGAAVADAPEGPFRDDATEPLVCQVEIGGSIDPYPFTDDDGQRYLYWKNDGNCCAKPVGLWVQPLSGDGLSLEGKPTELLRRDQPWEIPLIENPAMVLHGGTYYLFYSGNWWESHEYAVGYAVCESAAGPCHKPLSEPIFSFTPEVMGPGGQAFFTDAAGTVWMAYHAWTGPDVGYPSGVRSLRIEPVRFEDGRPVISGPTADPQLLP